MCVYLCVFIHLLYSIAFHNLWLACFSFIDFKALAPNNTRSTTIVYNVSAKPSNLLEHCILWIRMQIDPFKWYSCTQFRAVNCGLDSLIAANDWQIDCLIEPITMFLETRDFRNGNKKKPSQWNHNCLGKILEQTIWNRFQSDLSSIWFWF